MIRRPKDVSDAALLAIARHGDNLVTHDTPYPTRELLTYYLWSWRFNKIALGRHFIDVFRQRTNVCSGSYWEALVEHANLPTKEPPEAWYPARLAADTTYFDTILDITVSSATSSGSKESDHAT